MPYLIYRLSHQRSSGAGEVGSFHFLFQPLISSVQPTARQGLHFLLINLRICFQIPLKALSAQVTGSLYCYGQEGFPGRILIGINNLLIPLNVLPVLVPEQVAAQPYLPVLKSLSLILLLLCSVSAHSLLSLPGARGAVAEPFPACPYHYNISASSYHFR